MHQLSVPAPAPFAQDQYCLTVQQPGRGGTCRAVPDPNSHDVSKGSGGGGWSKLLGLWAIVESYSEYFARIRIGGEGGRGGAT